ncbi:MAG: hypothetical protein DRP10_03980 [Candidatus Aenigmatarchaeota archaeon]|nr:MAG: hypothetical protein DRP10_03980 [Candidatus Aenigmarchaeota archaeon]
MVVTQTVKRKVLEGLKGIGLNLYERNLYTALLIKKIATASELSELSGVPRARVYDVLESLEQKGFVIVQHGSPFKYVAVEPVSAFENLKLNVEREADQRIKRLEELKKSDIMRELVSIYKKDLKLISPENFTGLIKSNDKINMQIKNLLAKTSSYVNILTSEKGLEELTYHLKHFSKLKKNKVNIRVAAPITDKNKGILSELLPYMKIKDIKGIESPLGKLHIFDGEHVILGLVNDREVEPSQEVAFWTKSSHVAKELMEPIFNNVWERAAEVQLN